MTNFKVTLKIRSKKNEFTEISDEKITDFIKTNPVGYEVLLSGNYIPYYDFDNKYATEAEQKKQYQFDLSTSYAAVKKVFNETTHKILSFDACGHDPKADVGYQWKNSFHYRVRGAGYYECGTDIPKVEGQDDAVYKRKNSRQLIRLPFCSKEGNKRPLLRIIPETGDKYNINEIVKINETCKDYIIQNIENETKRDSEKQIQQKHTKMIAIEFREMIKIKNDIVILKPTNVSDRIKKIDALCKCLKKERFEDRQSWLRFMRCLKNMEHGSDPRILDTLAHKYSKISSKYNESEVSSFFTRHQSDEDDENSQRLGIGSLCYWAKVDNPKMYDGLREHAVELKKNIFLQLLQQAEDSPKKYSFPDYTKFVNKRIENEYELVKYLTDTVIHVIDGGNHKLFTRSLLEDGSLKFTPTNTDLFFGANNFTINIKGNCQLMNNYFINHYYHVKNYNVIDFIPYLENNPCTSRTFNLFQGFQFPYVETNSVIIPPELEIMFYHIKTVICDDNDEVYQYILNYITHMFKCPDEKPGVALLLQSKEHGTGKNRLTDFLMNCVGLQNIYKANKMEDVCASFNYHMQGKILIVGDEIANYASHKFADLLKALITEVTKAITPKGKDSYTIKSFERYIFTSNNDFAFRVEKGDRRLLPLRVNAKHKNDEAYFTKLSVVVDTPELQEKFFNYMASRNIDNWNFRKIPNTAMKSELIQESFDPAIHFLIDSMNEQYTEVRSVLTKDFYTYYKAWCDANSHRSHSDRKFGKELLGIDINKVRKMAGGKRQYYYTLSRPIIEKKIQTIIKDDSFKFEESPIINHTSATSFHIADSDDED